MQLLTDAWTRVDLPSGTVATVGNFDGVHLGQQAIVRQVVQAADSMSLIPAVVTFEPHPLEILRPEKAPPRLTTIEQKARLLAGLGVEAVVVIDFNDEFSRTPAAVFVERMLFERLDVRALFIGSRFVFGRDREGDLELLRSLAERDGRTVTGVDEVIDGSEPISSTRIRAAVSRGEVEEAARLLGRPYGVEGRVVHGDGLGRRLGWPTVNLKAVNELLPAFGVYRSRVRFGSETRRAVTNVGLRPTMHVDGAPTLESHILDYDGDLYDETLVVELVDRLRGERQFASAEELRQQIARDVAEARRRFELQGGVR